MRSTRKRKYFLQRQKARRRLKKITSLMLIATILLSFISNFRYAFATEAAAWPNVFVPYKNNGEELKDIAGEEHPIDVDITSGVDKGFGPLPSVYYAVDKNEGNIFFRMRLKGNPYDRKGGFLSSVWSVQLGSTDGKFVTIGIDGKSPQKDFVYIANADGTNHEVIYETVGIDESGRTIVPGTRITEAENGQYFIDFQVPIQKIIDFTGKSNITSEELQLFYCTSKAANLSVTNKDCAQPDGETTNPQTIQLNEPFVDIDGGTQKEYSTNSSIMTGTSNADTVSVNIAGQTKDNVTVVNSKWQVDLSEFVSPNDATKNILQMNGDYSATVTANNGNSSAFVTQRVIVTYETEGYAITIDGGSKVTTDNKQPIISGTADTGGTTGNTHVVLYKKDNTTNSFVEIAPSKNNEITFDETSGIWSYDLKGTAIELGIGSNEIKAELRSNSGGSNGTLYAERIQIIEYIQTATNLVKVNINTVDGDKDAFPVIKGTSNNAKEVEVIIDDTTVGIATPDESGNWSVGPLEKPLKIGNHRITAIATDPESGNSATDKEFFTPESPQSGGIEANVYLVDDYSISIDNGSKVTINDNKPTIRGRTNAGAGQTIKVNVGGTIYEPVVEANGTWTVEVPNATPLKDGMIIVKAIVTDGGATATQNLIIDTKTNVAFTNLDGFSVGDSELKTAETTPDIEGTAEENATLDLRIYEITTNGDEILHEISSIDTGNGGDDSTAEETVDWSYSITEPLTVEKTYRVYVSATDEFGNEYTEGGTIRADDEFTLSVVDADSLSGANDIVSIQLTDENENSIEVVDEDINTENHTAQVTIKNGLLNDFILSKEDVTPSDNAVIESITQDNEKSTETKKIYDVVVKAENGETQTWIVTVMEETNKAPVAAADSITGDEDTEITIDPAYLLENDTDERKDTLNISIKDGATNGNVSISGDQFTYTPNKNFSGTDSFTYTITDDAGLTATTTVTIKVNPINDAPIALGSTASTDTNKSVSGEVYASDPDESDTLTYSIQEGPDGGTVSINETTGVWTYTPNNGYAGVDTFTVLIEDGAGAEVTATVTIIVNSPPVVAADTFTGDEDGKVTINPADLLENDTDPNDNSLTIVSYTDGDHGIITQIDGQVIYTPAANYNGSDSFTYTVSDGHGGYATGIVTVTIKSVNDAPIAIGSIASTDTNVSVSGGVNASDLDEGDKLTYNVQEGPDGGTVSINETTGVWTYTPNNGYAGVDTFTVLIEDGAGAEVTATVTIIVNSPPVAAADTFTGDEDGKVTINPADLLENDTDPNDHSLTIVSYTDGDHGIITQIDGQVIYTPAANYHGTDSFTYSVSDGHGGYATEIVTMTIQSINDAPIAVDSTVSTDINESVSGKIDASDVDGDKLTYQVTGSEHGATKIDESGKWTYIPNTGFSGEDIFKITVDDGKKTATATITVTVNMLPLDGWVGERSQGDTDSEIIVKPGQPLRLSAISDINIESVEAEIGGKTVTLRPVNPDETDGEWVSVNYRLPDDITNGTHKVIYKAYKAGDVVQVEDISFINEDNKFHVIKEIDLVGNVIDQSTGNPINGATVTLYDPTGTKKVAETTTDPNGHYTFENIKTNDYLIVIKKKGYGTITKVFEALPKKSTDDKIKLDFSLVKFNLTLSANPSSIVGDGKSTTQLKATITDMNGKPISNVDVDFTTEFGAFSGKSKIKTIKTDNQGIAVISLTSEKIDGILAKSFNVIAKVNDNEHALYGEAQLLVSFEPASITGIVTNNEDLNQDGTPDLVEGAIVRVTKDFDEDGIIDFSSEYVTGRDGKYSIAIPRGGITYDVSITITKKIGTENKALTFKQNVQVGTVTGAGNESFDAQKAITGIVVGEGPNGTPTELPNSEQLKAYLIDENGDYVTKKGYSLDTDGLFNIEGLSKGNYSLEIKYVFDSGEEITINKMQDGTLPQVSITDNGQMNIAQTLIDPYGTITDPTTGEVIVGAKVVLYYADTGRNISNGIKPNTIVELPPIPGFAPNNNINPQLSDVFGKYAYMVFPHTDYYLVVTKSGYEKYTSPVISVETAIVKHDINMNKIQDNSVPDEKQDDNTGEQKDNNEEHKENTKKVEKREPDTSGVKEQLPDTSTNTYNYLFLGLVLIICGFVLLFLRKRRGTTKE